MIVVNRKTATRNGKKFTESHWALNLPEVLGLLKARSRQ